MKKRLMQCDAKDWSNVMQNVDPMWCKALTLYVMQNIDPMWCKTLTPNVMQIVDAIQYEALKP